MKRVVILGGGIMQTPALKIAKKWGWWVGCADGDASAVGRSFADRFFHLNLRDHEGLLRALRSEKEREGLDGVLTVGTDFSHSVAWITENLGLPGISYQTALDATDKVRMRRRLKKHGILCPRFAEYTEEMSLEKSVKGLKFPVVVKPVDNMGGRGIRRVDTDGKELREALKVALGFSRSARALIEEYMDGPELSLDALIYRGEITICGLADRHIEHPPYFVEMGHTIPAALTFQEQAEAIDIFKKGIAALGIHTGATKGDIKLTSDGAMVGEIAARLSGGYMSGWTYPYSSGVSSIAGALRIAVGEPPGDLTPSYQKVSAERSFISIPGRIKEIRGVEKASRLEGVCDLFLRVKEGDLVHFPRNNVEKCGSVVSCHQRRKEAVAISQAAVRDLLFLLDPQESSTGKFLNHPYPRTAFSLRESANRLFLSKLEALLFPFDFATRVIVQERRVQRLPSLEKECAEDWHGEKLRDLFTGLLALLGLREKKMGPPTKEDALFWISLVRGGKQGVLWTWGKAVSAE